MSEKRKVATDALETLGTIIESGGRDAIHLAVEPAVAGEELYPGAHVGIVDGLSPCIAMLQGNAKLKGAEPLGIVDPFLTEPIQKGQMFWLVVYPRQITSLRHVWSHPKFPAPIDVVLAQTRKESEVWINSYAADLGMDYDELMVAADRWEESEEWLCEGGRFEGEYTSEEFWDHWEIVRGRRPRHSGNFFTCSC